MTKEQIEAIREHIKKCGSLEALTKARRNKCRRRFLLNEENIDKIKRMFKNG